MSTRERNSAFARTITNWVINKTTNMILLDITLYLSLTEICHYINITLSCGCWLCHIYIIFNTSLLSNERERILLSTLRKKNLKLCKINERERILLYLYSGGSCFMGEWGTSCTYQNNYLIQSPLYASRSCCCSSSWRSSAKGLAGSSISPFITLHCTSCSWRLCTSLLSFWILFSWDRIICSSLRRVDKIFKFKNSKSIYIQLFTHNVEHSFLLIAPSTWSENLHLTY